MYEFGVTPRYMVELMQKDMFGEMFAVMQDSFPKDEYRPREKQLALFDDERYKVYFSRGEDGKIAAFIAAWQIDGLNFLEHFAVRKDLRGAGLGGAFLDEVLNLLQGQICLEVEPPESEICSRRINFYMRHGFYLNEYEYFQPPLSDDGKPKRLMLMTHGAVATADELEQIKNALYEYAYKTKAF